VHANGRRDKSTPIYKPSANGSSKDVQSQISHLEELVISLMSKTIKASASTNTSLEDDTPLLQRESTSSDERRMEAYGIKETEESFGRIDIEDDQPNYVGNTHWAAILDNVSQFPKFDEL